MGHPRSRFVSQLIRAVESPDREASFIGGRVTVGFGAGTVDRNLEMGKFSRNQKLERSTKIYRSTKYTEIGKFSRNPINFFGP